MSNRPKKGSITRKEPIQDQGAIEVTKSLDEGIVLTSRVFDF